MQDEKMHPKKACKFRLGPEASAKLSLIIVLIFFLKPDGNIPSLHSWTKLNK